jgi:NADPH:quinone reductase-like Zn-dependent oxidoreductase
MGADFVVNHHKDLKSQIKEVGIDYVDYILCLNETDIHFESMKQLVAPQGKICAIVQTNGPVDLGGELLLKRVTAKSNSLFSHQATSFVIH